MAIKTEFLQFSTHGNNEVIDITPQVNKKLAGSGLKNGIVTASVIGSTGGLTTCEYEPGLVQDLNDLFNRLIPKESYHHDQTWHDGNGHSHLRASLLGPSLTIPFSKGQIILGTWQQIIFIDFDNRSRQRKIVLQFMGE
ncbi:MAG: secondary thiamine-phosphate synthase enzyme YjbQ [Candidatus Omnitrophota bacterium]